MERVRLPELPFGNGKPGRRRGKRKRGATRPLKAVQGMKEWIKSQAVMCAAPLSLPCRHRPRRLHRAAQAAGSAMRMHSDSC